MDYKSKLETDGYFILKNVFTKMKLIHSELVF